MAFGGEDAESYYDDGITASMRGDLAHAVKCFEKAIHLDSTLAAAYHQIAKCYLRLGHAKRAAQVLREVVSKRPNQAAARLDFGYALLGSGQTDEAQQQFSQLIAVDSGNARAHFGLAHVYFDSGDAQAAISQAQKGLALGGDTFAGLFLLGRAAKLAGDDVLAAATLEKADRLIERTLASGSDGPEGCYLRGEVSYARDQYATALEFYRDARDKMDPEKPNRVYSAYNENFTRLDTKVKIGLCYQQLGKLDRAKEIGQEISEEDPNHPIGVALRSLES